MRNSAWFGFWSGALSWPAGRAPRSLWGHWQGGSAESSTWADAVICSEWSQKWEWGCRRGWACSSGLRIEMQERWLQEATQSVSALKQMTCCTSCPFFSALQHWNVEKIWEVNFKEPTLHYQQWSAVTKLTNLKCACLNLSWRNKIWLNKLYHYCKQECTKSSLHLNQPGSNHLVGAGKFIRMISLCCLVAKFTVGPQGTWENSVHPPINIVLIIKCTEEIRWNSSLKLQLGFLFQMRW